jgi:5-methylcytosine-specific restriction protein A
MRQSRAGQDDRRASAVDRGYGARWARYRAMFLREHPLCADCERDGIVEAAVIVDHIVPVHGPDDQNFWPSENHQPLCIDCHAKKTGRERRKGN